MPVNSEERREYMRQWYLDNKEERQKKDAKRYLINKGIKIGIEIGREMERKALKAD